MTTTIIPAFTFGVDDVFEFSGGITVFVGKPTSKAAPRTLTPCEVEVLVDGRSVATIQLISERMSGHRDPSVRAVETRAPIDLTTIRGHECQLIHRE
jgi:hypothetical protein